jgi:peptidoglycan/LPS O-acetylase OafA/YrhL
VGPTSVSSREGTLAAAFDPRSNALNSLRLVLATAVIFSHAALLGGYSLPPTLMMMLGEGAVDGFFAVSGFLLARSWLQRPQWGRYLWHRCLRILPAFWVCLAVTAFVTVPLVLIIQGESLAGYVSEPDGPWSYLWRNAALWMSQPAIAGTPFAVAYPGTWNGSLWTLFWEFLCYLALAVLGLVGVLRRRWLVLALAVLLWLITAAKTLMPAINEAYFDTFLGTVAPRLLLMFAIGAALWVFADTIPLDPLFIGAALLFLAAALVSGLDYRMLGGAAWAYLLLALGCRLPLRFGSRNDISYGVYIYAFPIQQAMALTGLAAIGWLWSAALAVLLTVPFAVASWFLVERPVQRWKAVAPGIGVWVDPRVGLPLVFVGMVLFGSQMFGVGGY